MAIYKRDMADINLETGNIHRTFLNHTIGYKDQKADHFGIRVFRNGEPVDLTGVSVQGIFMPPQGDPIAITSGNTVSGNEAEVVLPQACYNYDGQFCLAIKLVDSNNSVTGTMRIVDGMVDNTHASGTVAPTGAVPTYQEILSTYDAMVAATAAANGAIAPLYANLTFPVKVGQYAIVDGALKRAIVDIATSEAYTAAHWAAAKIGPDVSDLKSAFESVTENTRNLWVWGDVTVTGTEYIIHNDGSIPAGTYTISAEIERATQGNCKIYFYKDKHATADLLASPYLASGSRNSTTFTLDYDAHIVFVASGAGTTSTATATWKNVQLELGTSATDYINPITAVDLISRGDIAQITGNANSMIYYQALTTTDDLDTLTRSGLYAWGSSNVPQNCPVNAGCKLLCMYTNNVNISQIIVPSGDYFVRWRYKMSTGWSEWSAIPDRTYIDNEIIRIDRLISDSFTDKYNPVSITGESGYYWNRETDTAVKTAISSYTAYTPVSVQAGEKYSAYIYSASSSKQRPVLLVDDNYLIQQSYLGTKNAYNTFSITIPNGVTKILLCTDNSHASATRLYKVVVQSICDAGMFNFKNANIAIIGDSISTNGNYSASNLLGNVPEIVIKDEDVGVELSAYATYYDIGTTVGGHEIVSSDVGTEITFTPVEGDVGKFVGKPKNNNDPSVVTWWEVAQAALGFNPIPVCWSGSSITSHEGTDEEYKTSYAWHPAQIRKCGIRTPGTMTRTAPDMIIIYRGTNDFSHSPYSKLTEDYFDSYPWTYPDTDVITGGYGYKEGLCLTIRKLREAYPMAKIVLCTCNFFKRVNYSSYPINNGEYTENQLNNAIREVANYMGCGLIEFDKDGLTYENASSTYYQDSTAFTHPTTAGHRILGTKALRDLMSQNNMS